MTIQITPDGYITLSGKPPIVGKKYNLEDATEGTAAQNKVFHALCQCYFTSGCHSYDCKTWLQLRELIKRDLGAGFESYVYADGAGIHKVKTLAEIPEGTLRTHTMGKLKSWADYTKTERRDALDRLISEMMQAGVNTVKFTEILEGLNK